MLDQWADELADGEGEGEGDSDDEFADFSSFQQNCETDFADSCRIGSDSGPSEPSNKLSQLFVDVFPNQETIGSVDNTESISKDLLSGADQNSKKLWQNLKDLENASSLRVKWQTSHCFQLLLASLNIDPRNIILWRVKTTSVPKPGGSHVLSAEALQVLQELPNLSFMRAKSLMFPLFNMKKSSANDHSNTI